ncbi:exodeoxyribonuclease V subunit alpha [Aeromicrobium sp. CF3.5]|uniref:exodeoxyribonuclease V subunit alpha n=1 Tax=Aeromicrobium sp. CF3.5 TaxID=3373078 RepID=UPI003EE50A8A
MIEDRADRRIAVEATGVLRDFNRADVLSAADVHVAVRFGALLGETRDDVLLATALTVRAVRHGSVCVDLLTVHELPVEDLADGVVLTWPDPDAWLAAVSASALVDQQVLRLEGSQVYLDRYWREEQQVCDDLLARLDSAPVPVDHLLLEAALDRVLGDVTFAEQRAVVESAAHRSTTVLTGGPGTGKTTTVARLLAIAAEQHEHRHGRPPRIAMCAPTAKAAARLSEAVAEQAATLPDRDRARLEGLEASTLHRLLGALPGLVRTRFRHDRHHRLPHDIVVVDETSMVALTQMARLLEAVRPDARLVLVGDADQLASIEAGAVLADIVEGLAEHPDQPVARLRTVHRFGGAIGALADALRRNDPDDALAVLTGDDPAVQLIDPTDQRAIDGVSADVVQRATALWRAAEDGDAETALAGLDGHRLLCAHREGRFGVRGWNARIELGLAESTGAPHYTEWYPGRPVLVTANNSTLGIWNGDVGVTMRRPDGRLEVALATSTGPRRLSVTRLPDTETMHATTVHKAQGSQASVVTVVMPPDESALLTRELFYTAVTRAQQQVRVLGTEDAVREAMARQAVRASGLAARLRSPQIL